MTDAVRHLPRGIPCPVWGCGLGFAGHRRRRARSVGQWAAFGDGGLHGNASKTCGEVDIHVSEWDMCSSSIVMYTTSRKRGKSVGQKKRQLGSDLIDEKPGGTNAVSGIDGSVDDSSEPNLTSSHLSSNLPLRAGREHVEFARYGSCARRWTDHQSTDRCILIAAGHRAEGKR
ncbi:hypothetical protein BDV95DRAFT_589851 [Massariosphaeria phaeospora]|uniref:Uncharacterized protein n=1 Tax=Massariosphaeria phaeospora TaxID=100035 RepID=A0A7C8MHV3_9PLEO|nr:hypothetical protein BDV95DRAFT_589851 [Massariosphaeria phaeospora]